ncbi:hypothetical protein [Roseinatronobacter sp.]|uniref:hypothetical protein n=1 Tax=Roseinatronobacter sp. TaxID=1945755 RepID=UPI0025DC3EBA|nr:hypothetical protein [Rhodobaca sp.]
MTTLQKVRDEFLINTTTRGSQTDPAITPLGDEKVLVVWNDLYSAGGGWAGSNLKGTIYDYNGTRIGEEILLAGTSETFIGNYDVTILADGSVSISWIEWNGAPFVADWQSAQARQKLFSKDLQEIDQSDLYISLASSSFLENRILSNADIVCLENGDVIVVANQLDLFDGRWQHDLFFKRIQPNGLVETDWTRLSSADYWHTLGQVDIVDLGNGDFAVSWTGWSTYGASMSDDYHIFSAVVNSDNSFDLPPTKLGINGHPVDSKLVPLEDGKYMVIWRDGGVGWDIFGQIVDPANGILSSVFRVNDTVDGDQYSHGFAQNEAGTGEFIVFWHTTSDQVFGSTFTWNPQRENAIGQKFDAYGGKTGEEFYFNDLEASD